jgi:hypothetical protein
MPSSRGRSRQGPLLGPESRPPDIRGKEVRRITGFHHGFVV